MSVVLMTPAHVREREGIDHLDIAFLESARRFKLFRSNPVFDTAVRRLREAITTRRQVRVRLPSLDGDVIEEVELV